MKKLMIPMMVVAFLIAYYEQQKPQSNVFITIGALVFFMFGMMRLSAKTPSKNQEEDDDTL